MVLCLCIRVFTFHKILFSILFSLIVVLSPAFAPFAFSHSRVCVCSFNFKFFFYDFRSDKFSMDDFDFTDIHNFSMTVPQIIHSFDSFRTCSAICSPSLSPLLLQRLQCFCCDTIVWIRVHFIVIIILFISMVLTSLCRRLYTLHRWGWFFELLRLPL